jgi:hypothetical protein
LLKRDVLLTAELYGSDGLVTGTRGCRYLAIAYIAILQRATVHPTLQYGLICQVGFRLFTRVCFGIAECVGLIELSACMSDGKDR